MTNHDLKGTAFNAYREQRVKRTEIGKSAPVTLMNFFTAVPNAVAQYATFAFKTSTRQASAMPRQVQSLRSQGWAH